jgi:DNA polymerase-3 subunit delta
MICSSAHWRRRNLNYAEFIALLDRGRIGPVYLLTGDETFLIQSALERLLERALEPGARDFNYTPLDGEEATADSILNAAQTLPFASSRRLVVLKNTDALPAAEANRLTDYLSDPSPFTSLVFVAPRFDARRAFFQALTRAHPVVDCRPLPEGQLPAWIRQNAHSMGHRITEEAVAFLIEQMGSDLTQLHNEIIKASLVAGEKKPISVEIVQQVCGASGRWFIPDLLEATFARKRIEAMAVLKNLIESGEPPLVILGALARQLRQILRVKQHLLTDLPETVIQKKLGIWRTTWPKVLRQAKAFSPEDLRWAQRRLMETDAGLKGGSSLSNALMLEILILDLCSGPKKSLRRFLGRQELVHLDRQA